MRNLMKMMDYGATREVWQREEVQKQTTALAVVCGLGSAIHG